MACSLCALVVALPLVVPVAALVLRAAVGLTNRVLGRPPAERDRDYGYAVDEYALPPRRESAVPVPGFWRAAGIAAAIFLADLAAGVGLAILERNLQGLNRDESRIVFGCASLATAYLIQAGFLTLLLPTTVPRACLVAAFALLLGVPVALAAGGLALVGLNAIAPNMGR